MKSFDEWFSDTITDLSNKPEDDLPSDVIERHDGSVEVQCCVCEKWFDSPVSLDELFNSEYYNYCGGGPHCCP